MIHLAHPALLLLGGLLLLPLLVRRQRAWHYSSLHLLHGGQPCSLVTRLLWGLTVTALLLLLIALARPQGGLAQSRQVREVRDIVLTLDLSLSMDAGIASETGKRYASKLDLVQQAAMEFVQRRQQDRLGLLVFGDQTFGVWPLSTDQAILQRRLQRLSTLLPTDLRGTHVAKALEKSLEYLHAHGQARTRVVVLMTDGLDMLTPDAAARLVQRLNQHRITVYMLGINLPENSPFVQFIRRANTQYFNITKAEELDNAMHAIDRLETSYVTETQATARQELYPFFAVPGLLGLFVATVWQAVWRAEG
jgi:Ca-activated chloride channel family protein